MKKNIPISLLLIFTMSFASAQDISKNIHLKVGLAMYNSIPSVTSNKSPNINLDVNVPITDFLKTGIYVGTSIISNKDTSSSMVIKSLAVYYGVNLSVDLLSIIIKNKNLKPEIYVIQKLGGRSVPAPESYVYRGSDFIWASGLGLSYHFNKRVGAFIESTYGNNIFEVNHEFSKYGLDPKYAIDFRFGISLRF